MYRLFHHSLLLLASASGLFGCRTLPTTGRPYERSYNEEFRLSALEERDVVALAAEMGVVNIEKIETTLGHVPIISVKEQETISGNMVSFRTITMYSKKWGEWWNLEKLAETTISKGLILAEQPKTVTLTILKLSGKEYRVTLYPGIAAKEAEAIVGCFWGDQIRFTSSQTPIENEIHIRDFSEPVSIRVDESTGLHIVTFTLDKTYRWSLYFGRIENNVFVVHKVVTKQA